MLIFRKPNALSLARNRKRLGLAWAGWRGHCAIAVALLAGLCGSAHALPSYDEVRQRHRPSSVLLLDRSGVPLDRVRTDFHDRRGQWLPLDEVSVALQRAVILSEDQRFYGHDGVDWRAALAAAWGKVALGHHRGASTLSMQLVGIIDTQYRRGPGGRSLTQKFDQAMAARRLEAEWSKAQILEAYLNLAPFRGEIVGVDALARVLFQKHASGLNAREAALAAVLLRGPNAARPLLVQRACALLVELGSSQECKRLDEFVHIALKRAAWPWASAPHAAPHYAQFVLGKLRAAGDDLPDVVVSSLDASLQAFTLQTLRRRLHDLDMANVRDAAIVVMDNRSGAVLAYAGSSGSLSPAARVDHARALRQAGSTLKPFLYEQALAQQRLTAASLLHDAELDLPTGNGLYMPRNYDEAYAGWVSVRTALASSLNIPAVRALAMVTPDAFAQRLRDLGLPLKHDGDYYGYSLALGSADLTLLSLTNAYRALANLGEFSRPQFFEDAAPSGARSVMDPAAAWIVGDILADRHARARTFGLDSPLSTPFWTAVKTGTSKDMRDNWCLGWSAAYTVGVWVGNSGGASMREVSGVSGAGPMWHDIMSYLHRNMPSTQPAPPPGVGQGRVSYEGDIEPARREAFLADTRVERVRLAQNQQQRVPGPARIRTPADGTILALDPDIPSAVQLARFTAADASGVPVAANWRIDGMIMGQGAQLRWHPRLGKHVIELLDSEGNPIDRIHIEVRGAARR
ncbi:penicillin-binding protein 1C [Alcaligenaceae bacterium]|nr:penicillin-binding protein 1C [Alcaligenaceae bacterium]